MPEATEFLHLPEIDPDILRNLDTIILETCIRNYTASILYGIDLTVVDQLLAKLSKKEEIKMLRNIALRKILPACKVEHY